MADARRPVPDEVLTLHDVRLRFLEGAKPPPATAGPAVPGDRLLAAALPLRSAWDLLLKDGSVGILICDGAARALYSAGASLPGTARGRLLARPGTTAPVGLFALEEPPGLLQVVAPILLPDGGPAAGLVEVAAVQGPAASLAAVAALSVAHFIALALRGVRGVAPRARPGAPVREDRLVGANPAWLAAVDRAARAARTDSTVLITGETGTGKEVLARAIHRASVRRTGPFLAVNCGALPPSLAASELFGYVGGAFTGANPRGSPGKVEAANGGTLFLDEVSELAPEVQVALLRLLQEREVVRVGSHQPVTVDIRVIAATNRDLATLAAAGSFRQDLFFRLNVVPISIPPLRERREDILPLVEHAYLRLGCSPPNLSLASCERLTAHHWPGNVRELFNLVEQAVALQEDPADLLPLPPLAAGSLELGEPGEEERIRQALAHCHGNAAAAARTLGMGRSTLYRKLELYGIRLRRQVD